MSSIAGHTVTGIIISLLYFEVTLVNDTTFQNISLFTLLYLVLIFCAHLTNTDTSIVTNAFITKAVFTLVDERIKQPDEKK